MLKSLAFERPNRGFWILRRVIRHSASERGVYSLGADIAISVTYVLSPTILDVDIFKMINLLKLLRFIS